MNKSFRILAAAAMIAAAASCASLDKMVQMAENVKVTCEPGVLEAVNGSVDAQIAVTCPEGYFNPKAIVEVTPVLVYEGGEAKMKPFVYQGEKVKDNYKVVSADGQTVRERLHFDYVEGMEKSHLELRGVARKGDKFVNLPVKKVADGLNTTYMLVKRDGFVTPKADAYQEVISSTAEGQIKYLVNSAEVRNSELKGKSVKDFLAAIDQINADERTSITGTEILAYASPEGPENKNNELADKRSSSANKALREMGKKHDISEASVRSLGEDWEGFQQLVRESDIQDKDLILRVLSMYSDPNVREREIKNMSSVYTELADKILPELRRARFITNVEYTNFTADELTNLLENNINELDEEALLRAATLVKDNDAKLAAYKKAIAKFDSDRAKYNAAVISLFKNEDRNAKDYLASMNNKTGELYNNAMGVLAMRAGKNDEAASYFAKAGKTANENAAVLDILNGKYADAAAKLKDAQGHNAVLAALLNNDLKTASDKAASHTCLRMAYYKAIIAARKGDATGVQKNLAAAYKKDASLRERAANDIEFAGYDL